MHSREFHNSKEFHRRITQAAPSIPSPKTTRGLSQIYRRKEGLPSLIQATRRRLFSFWLQSCLFRCYARMSFRHRTSKSFCFALLMRRKGVSGSSIFNKPAAGSIHQNLKFKAIKLWDFKMDLLKWQLNLVLCNFGLKSYLWFWHYQYDFRPNCTPPNSITIINHASNFDLKLRVRLLPELYDTRGPITN